MRVPCLEGIVAIVALTACAPPGPVVRPAVSTTTVTAAELDVSPAPPSSAAEVEGTEAAPARDRAPFRATPEVERRKRCKPAGTTGKVNVLVTTEKGKRALSAATGPSLDPTAPECNVEALSPVPLPETASNVGGPGIPPSGFTSHFSAAW